MISCAEQSALQRTQLCLGDTVARSSCAMLTGSRFCLCIHFFYIFGWWSDIKLTGLSGWSSASLGAYVGDLPTTLGPLWAVLGRSQGQCWRSWAALGAYVGGLGLS